MTLSVTFFPKGKCTTTDPRGWLESGHICFAPSRAKISSISSVPNTLAMGTDLKRDISKHEDSLCNRVQLGGVDLLLVSL